MSMQSDETKPGWLKPSISVFLATVLMPIAATAIISGKTSVEKMLTNMVQPLFGAIVMTLVLGVVLFRRKEKIAGGLLVVMASLLWLLGSPIFVDPIVRSWEMSIESTDLTSVEPFDYLVVLGGGTSVAPDGRAQFAQAGDRVGYGARIFLSGKAKHLITTGDNLVLSGSFSGSYRLEDDPSQQTKMIWIGLGIPESSISEIAGQNTSSEMASLKQHPEYWQDKRCAILTSATHLPRAMKLAARAGITASPIAANYTNSREPITVKHFMPEAEQLLKLQYLIKESIGILIGR